MSEMKGITAKAPKLGKECTVFVPFGETAAESIEMFGDSAVNSNAFANHRVIVQSGVRRALEAGKAEEEIVKIFADAKMGVATSAGAVDPVQASLSKYKLMTADERREYLASLKDIEDAEAA